MVSWRRLHTIKRYMGGNIAETSERGRKCASRTVQESASGLFLAASTLSGRPAFRMSSRSVALNSAALCLVNSALRTFGCLTGSSGISVGSLADAGTAGVASVFFLAAGELAPSPSSASSAGSSLGLTGATARARAMVAEWPGGACGEGRP